MDAGRADRGRDHGLPLRRESAMIKKLAPMHPGEVLREEFLVPLKLSAGALARKMDVPRTRVERIAEGTAAEQGARYHTAALAQPPERLRPADGNPCARQEAGEDRAGGCVNPVDNQKHED